MESAVASTASTAEPTLATGRALDPRLYIDPSLQEAEQRLIFERNA